MFFFASAILLQWDFWSFSRKYMFILSQQQLIACSSLFINDNYIFSYGKYQFEILPCLQDRRTFDARIQLDQAKFLKGQLRQLIRQQFQLVMDNLKAQTRSVLSKVLQQLSKQRQQDQKNQLPNPQNQAIPITCKELVDLYSHNLDARQKMLLEITLANDLATEMNTVQFKLKVANAVDEMNFENNQFNIPEAELPKSLMNKTNKVKKVNHQSKKTQPNVQSHPEYFRVDHQICNRIFAHYKTLPLGLPKAENFNFEEKEHHKNSMNYHKVLQIFKDANMNLEINQKLLILRSIKKFCFNQNFISNQEFTKVWKVIVHGLGFKEQAFEEFLKKKSVQKQPAQKKNSIQKPRRNYRFKTDNSAMDPKTALNPNSKNLNDLSMVESKKQSDRKILQRHSSKKVPHMEGVNSNASYLAKAMEHQKISKVTWDSLFNMKETSMHSFIVIPSFVRNANIDQF